MPIPLDQDRTPGLPVLRRKTLGEQFIGGLIRYDMRDLQRDGQLALKPDGSPRKELVVTVMTIESTMAAALGDNASTPQRGELVRLILKGGGFGQWIEAKDAFWRDNQRGLVVGDMVRMTTTHAIRYESMGNHSALGELNSNEELEEYYQTDAYRQRRESLGFRGGLDLRPAAPAEAQIVADCEAAYAQTQQRTELEPAPSGQPDQNLESAPTAAQPSAAPADDLSKLW